VCSSDLTLASLSLPRQTRLDQLHFLEPILVLAIEQPTANVWGE
jgi:hypothetical protein